MSVDKNYCITNILSENVPCLMDTFFGYEGETDDASPISVKRYVPTYENEDATEKQERLKRESVSKKETALRIDSGEIIEQKSWQFVKELNSCSRERLDACALVTGEREYTYRQMFAAWDKYAEVFSSLEITGRNHSRAAILGVPCPETVFAIYALNMTGASISMVYLSDLKSEERLKKLIETEGITDLVLEDYRISPQLLPQIIKQKVYGNIRNIILLKTSLCSEQLIGFETAYKTKQNYMSLKKMPGVLFMEDLLKKYEAYPIVRTCLDNDDAAFICHTSGTTSGIHKPVPLSDRGVNDSALRLMKYDAVKRLSGKTVNVSGREMSFAIHFIATIHAPLSYGGKVILLAGSDNPQNLLRASILYKANFMFLPTALLEKMSEIPFKMDLSNIRFLFVGGGYLSDDARKRYNEFLKKNGTDTKITIGYGLSEAGGAVLISSPDREDASIGYPFPGIKVKIYDEEEGKYYDLEDGPRTGGLFISAVSVSSGRIDDRTFFELEEIDGEKYLNTYDLVDVGSDGAIYYAGRMNKYFVNTEGIRFDAGMVETAIASQPKIDSCGLAPVYDKAFHDTIPVLYVQTMKTDPNPIDTVTRALYNVFVRDERILDSNMPNRCVITDAIPYNESGKVDVHKIIANEIAGDSYIVNPEYRNGKLSGIRLASESDNHHGPAWIMDLVR